MKRIKDGTYLKPKQPNRFWRAFRVDLMLRHDGKCSYEVKCYGHDVDGVSMERIITMSQTGLEESSEVITEEVFNSIINNDK